MAVAVGSIDLNMPDAATHAALVDARLHENLVLCVRGRSLAPVAFRDAMARFGTPVRRKQLAATPECAEVNIISSEDREELADGKKLGPSSRYGMKAATSPPSTPSESAETFSSTQDMCQTKHSMLWPPRPRPRILPS